MANHPSAEKRARQTEKRRLRNRMRKSTMRTSIKSVLATNDRATAEAALKTAVSLIDRAGARGVIHRNQASRRVSRLVAHVKALAA